MLPVLQIGPLAVQAPGLVLLLGFWIGLTLSERYAVHFNVDKDHLSNVVWIALVAGVVGARLVFVGRYPQAFSGNLLGLISLNPAMLDLQGGALTAVLASLVYGQRKNMPLWDTLDALTPLMAVMGIAIGAAHFASGDAYGAPAVLPWSVELWGTARHPTQVYEIILAVGIAWLVLAGRNKIELLPGTLFTRFIALSAGARLFVEAFRGDSLLWFGSLRAAQVAAWLVLALALTGMRLRGSRPPDNGEVP
jgi:phosphatidylglycerol---prolipoprotein diacylglyceryl transferase